MGNKSIGVHIPFLGGYYFGCILDGIHRAASEQGWQVIVVKGTVQEHPAHLAWERVEGWIVVQLLDGIGELAARGIPAVTISAQAAGLSYPAIMPDNYHSTFAATRHLLHHGHQRIAFVGPLPNSDVEERLAGYRDALRERGLAPDPALFLDPGFSTSMREAGKRMARLLLEQGVPCSAVVAAADELALGVLEVVQAAGLRVPEDLAITGFDDLAASQHSTPSLTTVRQDPAALGRQAVHLLLAQLAGEPVRSGIHYVPTALILRRSCGCALGASAGSVVVPDYCGAGWQDLLAHDLVRQARALNPLDSAQLPAEIWPGAATLVSGLAEAVASDTAPEMGLLEQAWREAVALTGDMEVLYTIYKLLQRACAQHSAARAHDPQAQARIDTYRDRAEMAMLRAYTLNESTRGISIEQLLHTSYTISLPLIGATTNDAQQLGWLDQTPVSWGCLARWSTAGSGPAELTVVGLYARGQPTARPDLRFPAPAFPPPELMPRGARAGSHHPLMMLPVRCQGEDWGVLALAGPVETQLSDGQGSMDMAAALLSAALEREQLQISLESQEDALRELGSPVLPLLPGVLLVPLIGAVSAARAQQVMETLLHTVGQQRAHTVLLDITGVPLVDSQVADSLLRAARAVTLLGARVTLVGVRPEIAQSIVGLGIDLRTIATQPTLAAALQALQAGRQTP